MLNVILASVQVSGVDWTKLKNKFDINWRLCDQHSVTGVNWFTLTRSCLLVSEETPVLVGSCALCFVPQHEVVSPHPLVPRFFLRSFLFCEGPGPDPN